MIIITTKLGRFAGSSCQQALVNLSQAGGQLSCGICGRNGSCVLLLATCLIISEIIELLTQIFSSKQDPILGARMGIPDFKSVQRKEKDALPISRLI